MSIRPTKETSKTEVNVNTIGDFLPLNATFSSAPTKENDKIMLRTLKDYLPIEYTRNKK